MSPEQIRLAGLQGVITIISASVAYVASTPLVAKSVAFGSCVAMLGTLLLVWRFATGARHEAEGAGRVLRDAYRTALERFVLMACLLAIGFKLLALVPLWVLVGFVIGQMAWLIVPAWIRLRTQR